MWRLRCTLLEHLVIKSTSESSKNIHWLTSDCERLIRSDESPFELIVKKIRYIVLRLKYLENLLSVCTETGKFLMWSANIVGIFLCYCGIGPHVRVYGTWTKNHTGAFWFTSEAIHINGTKRSSFQFNENLQIWLYLCCNNSTWNIIEAVVEWFLQSPDLISIENLWLLLDSRIKRLFQKSGQTGRLRSGRMEQDWLSGALDSY